MKLFIEKNGLGVKPNAPDDVGNVGGFSVKSPIVELFAKPLEFVVVEFDDKPFIDFFVVPKPKKSIGSSSTVYN